MGKKLLALALVGGAAAFLFKTKKGAEVREQMGKTAGDWKNKLTDMYRSQQNGSSVDKKMA